MSETVPALLIDHGNSRVKWACYDGDCSRVYSLTASGCTREKLSSEWAELPVPSSVILCSVGDTRVASELVDAASHIWGLRVKRLSVAQQAAGVTCGYTDVTQLGIDRWAAVVAGWRRSQSACCVIDCGSAITLDAVDDAGQHLGGYIFPGAAMMRREFYSETRNREQVGAPRQDSNIYLCGRNTADAVASGTILASAGGIERMVSQIGEQLGGSVTCWLTGGGSQLVLPLLNCPIVRVPGLVFEGVALLGGLVE